MRTVISYPTSVFALGAEDAAVAIKLERTRHVIPLTICNLAPVRVTVPLPEI
jgi:hypothetical protein